MYISVKVNPKFPILLISFLSCFLSCDIEDTEPNIEDIQSFIIGVENPIDDIYNDIYIYDGKTLELWFEDGGSYGSVSTVGYFLDAFYFTVAKDLGFGSKVVELFSFKDNNFYQMNLDPLFADPFAFTYFGNELYFIATEAVTGQSYQRLYKIAADGYIKKIDLSLKTAIPDNIFYSPTTLISHNNYLYMQITNDNNGKESLYKLNLNEDLFMINNELLQYKEFVNFNGDLYFIGLETVVQNLYKFDNDIIEKVASSSIIFPSKLTVFNSSLYMTILQDPNDQYLVSWDGNYFEEHGFKNQQPSDFVVFNNYLYFNAYDTEKGVNTLYRYNGSIGSRVSSTIYQTTTLQATENYLYFGAIIEEGIVGFESLEQEVYIIEKNSLIPKQISNFPIDESLSINAFDYL